MNEACEALNGISGAAKHDRTQVPEPDGRPPRMWRRGPVMVGAVALTLAVLVAAATIALMRDKDDGSQIRDLIQKFATSVEADPVEAAAMLCQEEREIFEQEIDPDLRLPEAPLKPKISVSRVRVEGDMASATVKPASGPSRRMYFRKEKGIWTVCAPAAPAAKPAIGGVS